MSRHIEELEKTYELFCQKVTVPKLEKELVEYKQFVKRAKELSKKYAGCEILLREFPELKE